MKHTPFDPTEFAASFEASVARSNADHARAARLAALKAAVVDTGLAWWRSGYDDPTKGDAFDAACAAYAKAEADHA